MNARPAAWAQPFRVPANSDAAWAASLLAVDGHGLGGAVLRGRPDGARDAWLDDLRSMQSDRAPWRRVPTHVDDDRLLGGLDVAASLRAGRAVVASGLLAEADGGLVILPMAEQLARRTTALICSAMDRGEVLLERDGIAQRLPSRFAVVALDESIDEDEALCDDLADRLAFVVYPGAEASAETLPAVRDPQALRAARDRLWDVVVDAAASETLCGVASSLGIDSLRGPLLAQRAARAAAALAGRRQVEQEDLALAARLVLLPRARHWPGDTESAPPPPSEQEPEEPQTKHSAEVPEDVVLAAAQAALPGNVLARLQAEARSRAERVSRGRFGADTHSHLRGRPIGARPGALRGGRRLQLCATLKAAAPWQPLRARQERMAPGEPSGSERPRLRIRPEDFRVARFKARRPTLTVFVVDASGSAAAERLAEAKGAVELLLAECYVRRDQVALVAFRGVGAELLLSPTRALARARRELAGLPGGGGTPLATGLETARTLAAEQQRRGLRPLLVVMTDGRANIDQQGAPGHVQAQEDALAAARRLRAGGWSALVVDTSRRPRPRAAELAEAMGAQYLPLPHARAPALSTAVQSAAAVR